jgi:hypothetical protein
VFWFTFKDARLLTPDASQIYYHTASGVASRASSQSGVLARVPLFFICRKPMPRLPVEYAFTQEHEQAERQGSGEQE